MSELPHAANLRWGRFSEPGAAYHITKCRVEGLQLSLAEDAPAHIIVDSIRWHQERRYAHLLSFVVMPDHLHWTFVLGEERTLGQVLKGFASVTSRQIAKACRLSPRVVWQEEYTSIACAATSDVGRRSSTTTRILCVGASARTQSVGRGQRPIRGTGGGLRSAIWGKGEMVLSRGMGTSRLQALGGRVRVVGGVSTCRETEHVAGRMPRVPLLTPRSPRSRMLREWDSTRAFLGDAKR